MGANGKFYYGTQKIKTFSQLAEASRHNLDLEYRKENVPNADAKFVERNEVIIQMSENTYEAEIRKHMEDLKAQGAFQRKIRANAVLAYEAVIAISHEAKDKIDSNEFAEACKRFLIEACNPKEIRNKNGDLVEHNNVISCVLHMDEEGAPHIHALVFPINEKGELCANDFLRKSNLYKMQNSCEKHLSSLGLTREKGRGTSHENIKTFYAALEKELGEHLPEPNKFELATSYYKRADEIYRDSRLQNLDLRNRVKQLTQKENKDLCQYEKALNEIGINGDYPIERAINLVNCFSKYQEVEENLKEMQKEEPKNYQEYERILQCVMEFQIRKMEREEAKRKAKEALQKEMQYLEEEQAQMSWHNYQTNLQNNEQRIINSNREEMDDIER